MIACTDFIAFTNLYNVSGDFVCSAYPYLSASKCFHQKDPTTLATTILIFLVILPLMVLPVILMLLNPMRCFRKCLGKLCCCRGRTHLMLQTFMECFHGYYKDGTKGTRDCRYVAGFYFLIRIVLCFLSAFVSEKIIITLVSVILVTSALFISMISPYKERHKMNNVTDALFLFLGGLLGILVDSGLSAYSSQMVTASMLSIAIIVITLPLVYLATITLKHLYHIALVQ